MGKSTEMLTITKKVLSYLLQIKKAAISDCPFKFKQYTPT